MQSVAGTAGALLFATLLAPTIAVAKAGGGHSGGRHSYGSHSSGRSSTHSYSHSQSSGSKAGSGVQRDSHGRFARSSTAKHDFEKSHPCPATGKSSGACPSYFVNHVTPLKRGGADHPSNMQWQTKEAARQKDKTE